MAFRSKLLLIKSAHCGLQLKLLKFPAEVTPLVIKNFCLSWNSIFYFLQLNTFSSGENVVTHNYIESVICSIINKKILIIIEYLLVQNYLTIVLRQYFWCIFLLFCLFLLFFFVMQIRHLWYQMKKKKYNNVMKFEWEKKRGIL